MSLTPAVPFAVCIGNAVTCHPRYDMSLIEAAMLVMRPVAENSPLVKETLAEVQTLYEMAEQVTGSTV